MLAIKNIGMNHVICKTRSVAQGHIDVEKNLLFHASPNLWQQTIRIIIAVSAVFASRLWSQDISRAYLQSASKLTRKVNIKPRQGLKLRSNKLLKFLKPFYGLSDSGDY